MNYFYFFLLPFFLVFQSCIDDDKKKKHMELMSNYDNLNYQKSLDKILSYDKLNFGNGYNSTTSQEFFGVINYKNTENSTEILSNALGNTGFIDVHNVENKYELKKTLDISTSVDLNLKIKGLSSDNSFKSKIIKNQNLANSTKL